jgi:tRNA(fMet)-specific endonuclease VapC
VFVLDTNHVTELAYDSARGARLRHRLSESRADVTTSVITLEEELRGWLARINRERTVPAQVSVYDKLIERVMFFSRWSILPLDNESAATFARLRAHGIRIGTLDLKIAAITLAHDATLLTRNTADFAQVPGLKFENWLD